MPDEDDDVVGEMLQGRFGDAESDETESESTEAKASDSTESTTAAQTDVSESETTETAASSSSSGRTRDRTQYPMYLPEGQAEALNQLYERFNAERVLENESKAEKNKHFNEAVAELVLENQDELLERVEARIDEHEEP